MSSEQADDSGFLSGPLGIDIGPPLSARQRKAAAVFTLAQLLALAELRASSRRKRPSAGNGFVPRNAPCHLASLHLHIHLAHMLMPNGALAGCPRGGTRANAPSVVASRAHTAMFKLRQSIAKSRAEEEVVTSLAASAPQRPRPTSTAIAPAALAMKPIAIVPPSGTRNPPASSGRQLGCHLAHRRCGGLGGGGGGTSSLAKVYGGRVRVGQLPDDYAECFVGLDPVREPDPDELEANAMQCKAATAAVAAAAATAGTGVGEAAGRGGSLGAVLLGFTAVKQEMPFMFGANPGPAPGPENPRAAAYAAVVPAAIAAPGAEGGLLAPFATPVGSSLAAAGLSYTGAPYDAAPGFLGGAGGALGPAAAPAPDLMLDDDDSSETEDGDGGVSAGGGRRSMDTGAALGAAFDDFEGVGPLTQPAPPLMQPPPVYDYATGFGSGAGGGAFGYGIGSGSSGYGGMATGLPGSGIGGGSGLGMGTTLDGAVDDGTMVEEF